MLIDHNRDNPEVGLPNNLQQFVVEGCSGSLIAKVLERPARIDYVVAMKHNRIIRMMRQVGLTGALSRLMSKRS